MFTNLLAHADIYGVVDIHPLAISDEVGLPIARVWDTLRLLEAPDDQSRSPENEGRRIVKLDGHRAWGWQIVNYVKYRAIKNEDDRREQNRVAQEKWRNKNKQPSAGISSVSRGKPMQKQMQKEKESNTGESRAKALPPPSDVDSQVWADWLQLRKTKRAPVTQTVLNGAKSEAAKAGMTLEDFLKAWCRRGSQGLEAAWLKPDERQGAETAYQRSQREKYEQIAPAVAARAPNNPNTFFDVATLEISNA